MTFKGVFKGNNIFFFLISESLYCFLCVCSLVCVCAECLLFIHPLVVPWTCSLPGLRRRKTTKTRTLRRRSGSRRIGDVSSVGTWVTYAGTVPNTAISNRGPSEHQVSPERKDTKYDSISVILTDMHILKHTFRVLETLICCLDTHWIDTSYIPTIRGWK